MFILAALLFVPVFMINLFHLRRRKIPLYSWGTVIAITHLCAGFLSWILLPIIAMVISAIIEVVYRSLDAQDIQSLEMKYDLEERETEQNINKAQKSYEDLYCLITFTSEQDYEYRETLKALENNEIWHYVRGGIITSILVKRDEAERICEAIGIEYLGEQEAINI